MKTPRNAPRHALLAGAATAALLAACAAPPPPAPGEWSPQPPNPNAPYPAESRMNGEQGMVLLRVRTTPAGLPASVEVKESSGHARLDRSAVETVRTWRFKPTPDDGTVVWREVPIRFFITSPPQQPTMN
ncbi:TonB family protein [Variovorax boronicumulans]|uniref:energy transducer TonB n=1 Tax=Variovorax boronicumulans TaxID=436515 RepID=UPI002780275C|nr:energy transducer TonB [Variovorax boronicumulans]MDP9912003.1 TonB family protein [Variovorax boronicumulans]